MFALVSKQLILMGIIVIAAFIFAKAFKVQENESKIISKLLLYFINPCLVISSFYVPFDSVKLEQLVFTIVIATIVFIVMILFVTIFCKNDKLDKVAVVFTNCGFVGIPLIRGVFGDDGVFLLMGFLIIFNIFLWTYGYAQIAGKINLKKIITNPNIIGIAIGLFLFCTQIKLPELIIKPIKSIGDLNTATSMILIGLLFANFKIDKSYILKLIKVSTFRLVVCVLINIAVLFVVYKLFPSFPQIKMILFVVLICSACPSATSVPSLANLFDQDTSYASLLVSVTSILCIITIPALVALAELIIV